MSNAPRDTTAFEVREALPEAGCVVCRLALRSVGRWLRSMAYDQVNDVQLRTELREARGFCNPHAHRWLREARSVLGTSIVYRDLLTAALRDLDSVSPKRGRLLNAFRAAERGGGCPACRTQREAEARYLTALATLVSAEPGVLDGSDGLCVLHARAAVRTGRPGAEHIVQHTRSAIERLLSQLDEVIRKEDYRYRHEPRTDDERTAPGRAVARAAGLDGLVDTR
jgi:hypothetical protein